MMKEETKTKCFKVIDKLKSISNTKNVHIKRNIIEDFMDWTFVLCREICKNPQIIEDSVYRDYLKETETYLKSCTDEIINYSILIDDQLERPIHDFHDWIRILKMRSGMEAFKDMYQDTSLQEIFFELETSDADKHIHVRVEYGEGQLFDEDIPEGTPVSHWWWWLPKEPSKT